MRMRLLWLAPAAAALAVASALIMRPDEGSAVGTAVGVDVQTAGNSATGLGSIETCRRVEVGQTFEIDVWIRDVTGLSGWDLLLTFNHAQLDLQQVEFLFQMSFLINEEESGGQFLAAGQLGGSSGSGVLARVTFEALTGGQAQLGFDRLHLYPTVSGEIPVDSVTPGVIAIGQDCGGATPTQTSPPTATPSPSPTPTTLPSPTGTPVPDEYDVNCDQRLDTEDGLRVLEHEAGAGESLPGCPDVGSLAGVAVFGDFDCNGGIEPDDVLALLLLLSGAAPLPLC